MIEKNRESFREAKAKAGHPSRIKYPKKLKDAAIEYFKAKPSLTPSRMASKIGISTSSADKWFKSVKQAKAKDKIKTDPPNFVELKPQENADQTVANNGELRQLLTAIHESALVTNSARSPATRVRN